MNDTQSIYQPPIVLVFAGHDPTGGAGIGADIQALASQGCHTAPIITTITTQDTGNVFDNKPLSSTLVVAQAEAVLADLPIAVCKIGLLGSIEIIEAVQHLLLKYPHLSVVLDPVLVAGGGYSFTKNNVRDAMIKKLLPLTHIITPNSPEAIALTGITDSLDAAAIELMDYGCQHVCITGTHENTPQVKNTLYSHGQQIQSWTWDRLPHSYHGSGCTFAASLAGFLAQDIDMITAVYKAQHYTWTTLQRGFKPGHGQALPNRLFFNQQTNL